MVWSAAVVLALALSQVAADTSIKPIFKEDVRAEYTGTRIVSGWDAQPGQIPFQTSIRIVHNNGGVSGCGGSVVHREWVLTAAHCTVDHVVIVVRAGVTSMLRPEYLFETSEWYNHPTYDVTIPSVVQPNDVSIIKLVKPVTYTDFIQPVRIQPRAEAFRNYDREIVIASGFGNTWTGGAAPEVLQWVYLVATSNAACAALFGNVLINDAAICAGFYNVTSQSTCQGDSGGPLYHYDSDNKPVLIGISSFVAGGQWGCHSGFPAGFARPGPYHDWLQEVTGVDFDNLVEEEPTEPPTEAPTEAPTQAPTEAPTEAPTQAPTEPPTTAAPEPEEEDEDDDGDDSSEVDPELAELIKKIIVKVKVKININDEIKKKVKVKCIHELKN